MIRKLRIHVWTLGRWFALPFFGGAILMGAVLAGGSLTSLNTWLAFAAGILLMAGGHSFNTVLDTVWTKLDSSPDSHSVEKGYSAGSVVISEGRASVKEVTINAIVWYLLALVPAILLAIRVTPLVLIPVIYGMAITFMYAPSKFTYFHELVLGTGPIAGAILGALSAGTGHWLTPLLVTIPNVLIFSYAGLALDEYPDAGANLKKGVKSLAYKVWQCDYNLILYVMLWLISAFLLQLFLINIGILKPLTAITLVILPFFIGASVTLDWEGAKEHSLEGDLPDSVEAFKKAAMFLVVLGMLYPVLMLVGQVLG